MTELRVAILAPECERSSNLTSRLVLTSIRRAGRPVRNRAAPRRCTSGVNGVVKLSMTPVSDGIAKAARNGPLARLRGYSLTLWRNVHIVDQAGAADPCRNQQAGRGTSQPLKPRKRLCIGQFGIIDFAEASVEQCLLQRGE